MIPGPNKTLPILGVEFPKPLSHNAYQVIANTQHALAQTTRVGEQFARAVQANAESLTTMFKALDLWEDDQ